MAMVDITASEVIKAIEECDGLGRERFLGKYGFGPARYFLSHDGKLYDSKAVVGVAHGHLPGERALPASAFSGGADHAVALLRALGFTVVEEPGLGVDELLDRVARLRVNRSSGRPLLHQPITLLWAAGRARRAQERLLPWRATADEISALLLDHATNGERPRPDYPIAALHRAGLWELAGQQEPVPAAHGDSELARWFARNEPAGGLVAPVHTLLRRSGEARIALVDALLSTYFAGRDPEPLLHDVGLYDDELADDASDAPAPPAIAAAAAYDRLCRVVEHREEENRGRRRTVTSEDRVRSAAARRAVLLRCGGACESPHCTGQPDDVTPAGAPILDVDHVNDLALGGRDHPEEMVALCPNCHAVKTRGRSREKLRADLLAVARERHAAWASRRTP
jgi:5-methylcytosine-specific restriction protein A